MVLALWLPRFRVPILILGFLAGIIRVAARAHYPSDIVAGYALGAIYALYLARWLAVRGSTFRVPWGTLFPRAR
jgi:undecaprenyl-diphosphatase